MDAREYLNRKGIGVERESDRPNTLEEKAWARARGAGSHRPKAGTPHDWEDWERYHDDLADSAEILEQKIDKQAHRRQANAAASTPDAASKPAVEQYVPPVSSSVGTPTPEAATAPRVDAASDKRDEPAILVFAYVALGILLPPLTMGLTGAGAKRVLIGVLLTLCGWVPGIVYALWWLKRR